MKKFFSENPAAASSSFDYPHGDSGEGGVNLVLSRLYRLLGDGRKNRPIDGAEGLKAAAGAGNGDNGRRFCRSVEEKLQKIGGDKRHIDRKHKIQISCRMRKRRVNSP